MVKIMSGTGLRPNMIQATPHHLEGYRLNAVISNMHELPNLGLVTDAELTRDAAAIQKPYLEKALGHLANAEQRRYDYSRDINGPGLMPAVAPIHLIREVRQGNMARAEIAKAYAALTHI